VAFMAQFTLSVPPDVKMTSLGSAAPMSLATWARAVRTASFSLTPYQ
jgi:hypothetical protein